MALEVHRLETVDAFLDAAGAFLEAREAEHNLLFGICTAIRTTPELFAEDPPRFRLVTDASGAPVAASVRTPPNNEVLSEVDDPAAVEVLVGALRDDPPPGVLGPKEHAAHFARAWTDATGQAARLAVSERIFRLDRVTPPARPPSGRWRLAEPGDRELIADWLIAFVREAVPDDPVPERDQTLGTAERWIAGVYRQLYVWEDANRVVSLAGAGARTPNGVRIGPVYTPPEARRRGYAGAVTAAASQDQLDRGRRFCFLFTDLGNPTSNKIYREIGYRPVRDVDVHRFEPPA